MATKGDFTDGRTVCDFAARSGQAATTANYAKQSLPIRQQAGQCLRH